MGTRGMGPFDNDDAADIVGEIASSRDASALERALDAVAGAGADYLEAPEAQAALAAAEIVAAAIGKPGAAFPVDDEIRDWIARVRLKPSPALVAKARAAARRVLSEPSELLDLMSESDEAAGWKAAVDGLLRRLS